jgi:hypothetical protein
MSNHILFNLPLPREMIINILLFDKYIWREGKLQKINKLNKKDKRYDKLKSRPLIFIFIGFNSKTQPNNSITIYSNILEKTVIEQYNYIYRSIRLSHYY